MALTQLVVNQQTGPLPIKATFQPLADVVPSIFLTGTAYNVVENAQCAITLDIYDQNGNPAGSTAATVFINEVNSHKTLQALFSNQKPFQEGVTYTMLIQALQPNVTTADTNDYFSVAIVY